MCCIPLISIYVCIIATQAHIADRRRADRFNKLKLKQLYVYELRDLSRYNRTHVLGMQSCARVLAYRQTVAALFEHLRQLRVN